MADKKPVRKRAKARPSQTRTTKQDGARRRSPTDPAKPRATAARRPARRPPPDDLRTTMEAPRFGHIPWGYGEDRVTAMARDPAWIFVYWEVTDEAIARGRAEVQDPQGWCVLRVYDTTYRMFDGTNANWHTDIDVVREANNYYVPVHRPGATLHVDIGIKSREGWFATLARSAPVEMPRNAISPDRRQEWMTVTFGGFPPRDYRHRFVPSAWGPQPVQTAAGVASDADIAGVERSFVGEGWLRTEWTETDMDGRVARWVRWTGPFWSNRWQGLPVGREATVEVLFLGERTVVRTAWGERVVVGPFIVTIFGAAVEGRRLIDRWAVHYSWVSEAGRIRVETEPILARVLGWSWQEGAGTGSEARLAGGLGSSEWLARGASEWPWLAGSERRLGGASELLFIGASEARYLGASEMLGASERLFLGASAFLGGSEVIAAGLMLGGSEGIAGGRVLGGASEDLLSGRSAT